MTNGVRYPHPLASRAFFLVVAGLGLPAVAGSCGTLGDDSSGHPATTSSTSGTSTASSTGGAMGTSTSGSGGASTSSVATSSAAGGGAGAPGAGGGGSAGAGGGGADAGASDGGPSNCATAGTELCDDFESGAIDPKIWHVNKPTGSASVAVDDVHAHSGKYAVHVKVVPNQQSTAMIDEAVTFPAASNSFYSRMWVYFSPDIPVATNMDFHTGFMFGTGNNDKGMTQLGMGMIGSAKQYLGYSIFYGAPKFEFGPWSKTLIVANQWVCIELFEDGSNPMTEIRQVWVNDTELTDLRSNSATAGGTQNPNHLPPKFAGVSFGLWEYHPIPTLSDMWIDDVRVSSKKIGCAN